MLVTGVATPGHSQMPDIDRYQMMIEFLAKNGGRWESIRENYDQNKVASVKGDGFYCYIDQNKNFLRIRKVFHFRNSDFTTYERTWYWHPAEKKILFITWASDGRVETGSVEVVSEKAFVLTYDATDPEGNVVKRKEENFISGDREFQTKVLQLKDNDWEEVERFDWKR